MRKAREDRTCCPKAPNTGVLCCCGCCAPKPKPPPPAIYKHMIKVCAASRALRVIREGRTYLVRRTWLLRVKPLLESLQNRCDHRSMRKYVMKWSCPGARWGVASSEQSYSRQGLSTASQLDLAGVSPLRTLHRSDRERRLPHRCAVSTGAPGWQNRVRNGPLMLTHTASAGGLFALLASSAVHQ